MRKGVIVFVFCLWLSLFTPIYARAQNNTTPGEQNRIEDNQRLNQNEIDKEEARAEIQKRVEERKTLAEEKAKQVREERVKNHWSVIQKRIEATIKRLEVLVGRIESRIAKLSLANPDIDFTDIKTDVNDAKKLLANAKISLDKATSNLDKMLQLDDPKTAYESFRESVQEIKDMLIEAHRILVFVIGDIKGLRVSNEPTPTQKLKPTGVKPVITGEVMPTAPVVD